MLKPPEHLTESTREWWLTIAGEFELEAHDLRLLTLAGEALDRCAEARETVARDGAYYKTRFGEPKSHPAIAVERDARIAFARLVRELALDDLPEPESRPPRLRGRT